MFVVISIMYCGNDMATRGFIVDVLCIIQVIEITQTILPLRKCYGFKNRGRVGMMASGLQVHNEMIKKL